MVIENDRHVSLSGNTFVRDAVVLSEGNLMLGNYDLQMGDTAKFADGLIKKKLLAKAKLTKLPMFFRSYVVTNGIGNLIQKVDTVAKEFPVGTESDYYGASISNKGVVDNYSLRVFPDVLEYGTSGNQVSDINHFVKASWNIEEEVAGGSELDLKISWRPEVFPSKPFPKFGIGLNIGESWDKPDLETPEYSKLGFTVARDSITAMGTFAIGDSSSRLVLQVSPVLIADNTDNNPLHDIRLTFTDNQVWADSIQSISINGGDNLKNVSSILSNSITIPANNFPIGNLDYSIEIVVNGFMVSEIIQPINKVDQAIQFDPIAGFIVHNADLLSAQASSGLDIEYVCSNLNIVLLEGRMVHPIDIGSALIMASQKGNDVYNAAVSIQREFTVYELGQNIVFSSITPKKYGGNAFMPVVKAGASGNPVILTSSDSSIAICKGASKSGIITLVGAGTCKIYANQAGDATYAPALQQEQELVVNTKNLVTANVSAQNKIYDGTTTATLINGILVGLINNDDVTLNLGLGDFNDENAGKGKAVNAYGFTLTGNNASNYSLAQPDYVKADIEKAIPVITWNKPADIIYGTLLSETQLNATADIDGEIVYTPTSGAKLNVGNNLELKADFTPTDAANYNNTSKTVSINVDKATPVITWNNPADITYGTLLSEIQLNATTDIDGEIVYTPASETKLNAGNNQELKADFTPVDAINYNIADKTVSIHVAKATPVITWNNPADIIYGTLLSEIQLNATTDIDGEIVYTPASETKLNAGNNQELKVDFTPVDAINYNIADKTVSINVAKATPVIIWNDPADIIYGILLSETQLNATADIDGVFTYNPAAGKELEVGDAQELKLDFDPTDAVNYATAFKSVFINVLKSTGIDDLKEFELSVYPNPATNYISIKDLNEIENSDDLQIEIIDINGKFYLIKDANKDDTNTIDVQTLPSGMYILKIVTNNKIKSIKFFKQ